MQILSMVPCMKTYLSLEFRVQELVFILGIYLGYIGVIGIMEKKMETTI